ncbi:MAG: SDR family NAD(P)-dependent oxidoreductase [Pseudomonadota bacterium]
MGYGLRESTREATRIGIVGYGARLPQAHGPEEVWSVLDSGRCVITEIAPERWSRSQFLSSSQTAPGRAYTLAAGQLDDIWAFDPGFFGISPREAEQMDPQQRVLLETVWEALDHAGLPSGRLDSRTGVYIGAASSDYSQHFFADPARIDAQFMLGNTLSILANRISYTLNLTGPSYTVDTACSSSLFAFHHGVAALERGEIDTAIVGGVSLLLSPMAFVGFSRAAMLSPDGLCKAFDASANGYVRSEGAVVFVLRRAEDAQAAGDRVRGVVLGTGTNSDGRTVGMAMPSTERQAALLQAVSERAGIAADDLAFVEAHGTGTAVGDPQEAEAIGTVYGQRRQRPLPIGSAKTNFGHLEPTSGLVGLLKAQLALEKGVFPRSLHVEELNPNIPFDRLNLSVATEPLGLESREAPWAAAVNSFGFGGANAHVVLRQATDEEQAAVPAKGAAARALLLSARSEESLKTLAATWRDRLHQATPDELSDLMSAAAHRRGRFEHRLCLHGETAEALGTAAAAYLEGAEDGAWVSGRRTGQKTGVAFVFSGNGAQWAGMGRNAYGSDPAFTAAFDRASAAVGPVDGRSLAELLLADDLAGALGRSAVAQPILFAVQVAIVEALAAEGLRPDAVAGHSVGEVAAAWAAGIFDLDQAAHIVRTRSVALEALHGQGSMAAVLSGVEDLAAALDAFGESAITLAADNSPRSTTLSGPAEELERFSRFARKRRIAVKKLDIAYPYHSPAVDAVRTRLLKDLQGLRPNAGSATYVSSTTGEVTPGKGLDVDYWWRNARNPVRFRPAVEALVAEGCGLIVEIGPRVVLRNYVVDSAAPLGEGAQFVPSFQDGARAGETAGHVVARALCHGAEIADAPLLGAERAFRADPPLYAWTHKPYRAAPTATGAELFDRPMRHPLLGVAERMGDPLWRGQIDTHLFPWLADHVVDGAAVLPATAFAEIALAAGAEGLGRERVELVDFEVLRPVVVDTGHGVETRTRFEPAARRVEIETRRLGTDGDWTLAAFGTIRPAPEASLPDAWAEDGGAEQADIATLYDALANLRLDYGPTFRRVTAARLDARTAWVDLDLEPCEDGYLTNPRLLDAALHPVFLLIDAARGGGTVERDQALLPVRFARLRLDRPSATWAGARVELRQLSELGASVDITLYDTAGDAAAMLSGLRLKRVRFSREDTRDLPLWTEILEPVRPPEMAAVLPKRWADPIRRAATLRVTARTRPQPDTGWLIADAMCRRIAWTAIAAAAPEGRITLPAAEETGPEDPTPLRRALLRALEADGAVTAEEAVGETAWRLADTCPYPEFEDLTATLIEEMPERGAELLDLIALGEQIPERLSDGLLEEAPAPKVRPAVDRALWQRAEVLLRDLATDWPAGGRLHLLVLGTIAPATLDALAAALPAHATLTLSDGDPALVERQRLLAERHGNVRAAALADAVDPGTVDVILAVEALHRADAATLAPALAEGGLLLALEVERDLWTTLTAGQHAPWWSEAETGATHLARADLKDIDDAPLALAEASATLLVARGGPQPPAAQAEDLPTVVLIDAETVEERQLADALEDALTLAGHPVQRGLPDMLPDGWIGLQLGGVMSDDGADLDIADRRIAQVRDLSARRFHAQPAQIWLLTRGGAPRGPASRPRDAALWGLGRVLANERPDLALRRLDLPADAAPARLAQLTAAALARPTAETELIAHADGRLAAPRVTALAGVATAAADQRHGAERGRRLAMAVPGQIDSLHWRSVPRRQPEAHQVEIEVAATGLNFRDVMWAMGLLPDEALEDGFAGATLGMECAGRVVRAGSEAGFALGDEVIAFAPSCFASHVTVDAQAVAPIPGGVAPELAASIPTAFMTAQYALGDIARLASGETVLIHGGAGGVGLAALQIARRAGARVFATAGTPAKRRLLRILGAEQVFDSRTMDFADAALAATDGVGVDVVLNSLAGEAMERSIECLRPFGRFVELGKRDYYANSRMALRPFRQNLSYFGVDADQLLSARPDVAARLLGELAEGFAEGQLSALPVQIFPAAEVADAFALMRRSGHIGKILVTAPDVPEEAPAPAPAIGEGAWLLVGGLGGFGLATAEWLARQGVAELWLTSRSGTVTDEDRQRIERHGARVHAAAVDATDRDALAALFAKIEAAGVRLDGVIHAAMVLEDALFASLTPVQIERVLAPKIAGAEHLDALTRAMPAETAPRHLILYSSVTTLFGNPGQAPYVAANAYLEALAQKRRADGLPALAVAWGPIADVGVLERDEATRDLLHQRLGGRMLTAETALAHLGEVLLAGAPDAVVAIAPMTWSRIARDLPLLETPLFDRIDTARDSSGGGAAASLAALIAGLSPEDALKTTVRSLAEEAARILRLPVSEIDPLRPMTDLGFDSLMAVNLKMQVEETLDIELPLMSLADGMTLTELSRNVLAQLADGGQAAPSGSALDAVHQQHAHNLEGVTDAMIDEVVEAAEAVDRITDGRA